MCHKLLVVKKGKFQQTNKKYLLNLNFHGKIENAHLGKRLLEMKDQCEDVHTRVYDHMGTSMY